MRVSLLVLLASVTMPAIAQQPPAATVGARVDRLEKEMKAVQRKVFPQGQPGYFEPEIAPETPRPATGVPASAPLADLTARVSSLEQELARMTGQAEQNGFRLKQLEDQVARMRTETATRLDALERGGTTAGGPLAAPPSRDASTDAVEPTPAASRPAPATKPAAAAATASSSDAAEDAYLAAYRLWEQKDYDAAETALKAFVAKYPQHRRNSYARNLLGRTYLDDGKPAAAAVELHANYTKNPRGERAPDSLYYLGQALTKLDKPNLPKACEAYDALDREYGTTIPQALKDKVTKARADAKCGA